MWPAASSGNSTGIAPCPSIPPPPAIRTRPARALDCSRPAWLVARFPLQAATLAGNLLRRRRTSGQYRIGRPAQIQSADGHPAVRPAGIEAAAIGQPPRRVKEKEIRSAGGTVGLRGVLRFIVEVGEGEVSG